MEQSKAGVVVIHPLDYLARPLPSGAGWVTQWFGENPEIYKRFGLAGHNGLDYGVPIKTPVLAAISGVCEVGNDPEGYGIYIRVRNGFSVTIYAHLYEAIVKHGQTVVAGEQIALSGNSGFSTGPHLHFGLKFLNGRNPAYRDWIDPVPFRVRK